jgi:hypothetical protein
MEKLYTSVNGVEREYTEEEYAQAAIDAQSVLAGLPNTVRKERDNLLAKCDWTQTTDSPLSAEQKTAWVTYRQALRDIPTQSGFPSDITWPTKPE